MCQRPRRDAAMCAAIDGDRPQALQAPVRCRSGGGVLRCLRRQPADATRTGAAISPCRCCGLRRGGDVQTVQRRVKNKPSAGPSGATHRRLRVAWSRWCGSRLATRQCRLCETGGHSGQSAWLVASARSCAPAGRNGCLAGGQCRIWCPWQATGVRGRSFGKAKHGTVNSA